MRRPSWLSANLIFPVIVTIVFGLGGLVYQGIAEDVKENKTKIEEKVDNETLKLYMEKQQAKFELQQKTLEIQQKALEQTVQILIDITKEKKSTE